MAGHRTGRAGLQPYFPPCRLAVTVTDASGQGPWAVEWRATRRLALYATVRNLTNMANVTESYAPSTPSYARTKQIDLFGAAYTFGLKGTF